MGKLSRPHMTNFSGHYAKVDGKGIIRLVIVIVFFIILIGILLDVCTTPKTPATIAQAEAAIIAQGYEPKDITELYYQHDPGFEIVLNKCISFEKDDLHFEFFDFNNDNSAVNVFSQVYQEVSYKYNNPYSIEIDNFAANYRIYTLDSLGKYNVAIYVGNTAVYAYSDSENKIQINKILDAIDYLKP